MKLIYVDEAGNTGRKSDGDQPFHLLAAIIVDAKVVRDIENTVRSLAMLHIGGVDRVGGVEFHGYEIRAGKGAFKGKSVPSRLDAMRSLADIIGSDAISVGFVMIDKMRSPSTRHPHELAFQFMVERIQDYLARENDLGLLIADENKEVEQKLIEDLDKYKNHNTGWGYQPTHISSIVDSIHFVASKNNWLIQLADVTAFILMRGQKVYREYLASPSMPFVTWIQYAASPSQKADWDLYDRIKGEGFTFFKSYP